MQVRFALQVRASEPLARWRRVVAPGFDQWLTSDAGVRRYTYDRTVQNLTAPASYRTVVRFRWLDDEGDVIKSAKVTSAACRQPDMRPNLVPLRVDVAAADAAGEPVRYLVTLRNAGRTDAGPFAVALDPDLRGRRPRARRGRDAGRRDHRPGLRGGGAARRSRSTPTRWSTSASRTTTHSPDPVRSRRAAISWGDGGAGAGSHRTPAGAARRATARRSAPGSPTATSASSAPRTRSAARRCARSSACSTWPRRTTRRPATRCATSPTRPAAPSSSTPPARSWARRCRRSSSPTAATTRSRRSRGSSMSTSSSCARSATRR